MAAILLKGLAYLFYALLGAFAIYNAIDCLMDKRWFLFGFMIMGVIFEAAYIVKLVFEY